MLRDEPAILGVWQLAVKPRGRFAKRLVCIPHFHLHRHLSGISWGQTVQSHHTGSQPLPRRRGTAAFTGRRHLCLSATSRSARRAW